MAAVKAPVGHEKAQVPAGCKRGRAGKELSPAEDAGEELPVRVRFISPSLLMSGEVVILEIKPSLWSVVFTSAPLVLLGLAMVLVACVVGDVPSQVRLWGLRLGMALVGVRLVAGVLQWMGQTYVLTDRRVLSQRGIFSVEVSEAPLNMITRTHVADTLVQRVLGLGTVLFSTDSGHPVPWPWEHVSRPAEVHAQIVQAIDRYGHPRSV